MKTKDSLFSPSAIIILLKQNHLSMRNRYGQNFLINKDIASRILRYSDLQGDDTILEIGPGLGTLTFLLAERVKQVIAVEIDRGFSGCLENSIKNFGYRNIHVVTKDFSKLKSSDLLSFSPPTKVVSNFPYTIALKAIVKIVEEFGGVNRIVGTLQKESAERLIAQPGEKSYSSLSVYLQLMTHMNIVEKNITPHNFFPAPEVESSIVVIERTDTALRVDEALFKKVVRMSFMSRRKSLLNNLAMSMKTVGKKELKRKIKEKFRDENIRAEELSVEDFIYLCDALEEYL